MERSISRRLTGGGLVPRGANMNRRQRMCRTTAAAFDRRVLLKAASAMAGLSALIGAAPDRPRARDEDAARTLGIPGPYPGRVVEVRHPGSVRDGVPDPDAVAQMVERGLSTLTGI